MFTKSHGPIAGLGAAALVMVLAGSAQAQPSLRSTYGRLPTTQPVAPALRPPTPIPDSRHMPGWDWKYRYPQVYFSTYGYWPYPYPYVYPYTPVFPVNPYYPAWPYGSTLR
jgi:hypothetical protein